MNHFSIEDWKKYLKNEISDDARGTYENHLYSCDQCLEVYMLALAEEEAALPAIEKETDFINMVMNSIAVVKQESQQEKQPKRSTRYYQTAAFHFVLAAAMTLLLMGTGVFQSVTGYTDTIENRNLQEKQPSITEGIMDRTFTWLDSFNMKNKEANQ
ncbi:hypothetical protein CU633_19750 [Bacillus sp. V3-13]|uniref:hypothetical protein n=1 Tax=Bacillus sp. V3-13 TaxID=2053728 RepID=UPI000C75ED84|nr:hypothetical protein [Bacillus sp. V3-13]PLR75667.1 hypothetical protein CU633_19750 [Bacillus sp. V3-13]